MKQCWLKPKLTSIDNDNSRAIVYSFLPFFYSTVFPRLFGFFAERNDLI